MSQHLLVIFPGEGIGPEVTDVESPLISSAIEFCQTIFSEGGAVLEGPGGDRFVYDCRRRFGLFHKLNSLNPSQVPLRARRIKDDFLHELPQETEKYGSGRNFLARSNDMGHPCCSPLFPEILKLIGSDPGG
jgi:hypothetical protein